MTFSTSKLMSNFQQNFQQLANKFRMMWNKGLEDELKVDASKNTDNPYIAARKEWNLMFGDLIKAKYNWQRIALIALISNIILIFGLIMVSTQSRYIPYAVKVDALGNSSFAGYLTNSSPINPLEINAFIRRYVTNVRSVIADPIAEKQALDFVYATSTRKAAKFLNEEFRKNSPFKVAQQATVEVQNITVLQKSDKTWQVSWTEIQRNLDGNLIGQTHWEALMTVNHHPVSDARIININPLGLFVEHITWSQQF